MSVVVATNVLGYYGRGCSNRFFEYGPFHSIYVLNCEGGDWARCAASETVIGADFHVAIEIMADADTLLVSAARRTPVCEVTEPYSVEKYSLREIRPFSPAPGELGTSRIGQRRGVVSTRDPVVVILRDPDGRRAHLVAQGVDDPERLTLHTIDVETMVEVASPIALPRLSLLGSPWRLPRAALSPDGGLLVTTRLWQPAINVADLRERRAWSESVADAVAVVDLSFSHGPENHGLLAMHLQNTVNLTMTTRAVISELGPSGLAVVGTGPVIPNSYKYAPMAVEWSGDGQRLIASVDSWPSAVGGPATGPAAAVFRVEDGGRRVTKERDLYPCDDFAFVVDIVTANGSVPTPTPTPSPIPSVSPSATPPPTTEPPATPSPTASGTPTEALPLAPVYLPIVLREHCEARMQRVDVALVIDASTTMRDDRTAAGRTKLTAAIEAATTFVGTLALPLDQAAVITFNSDAQLLQGLSGKRADIEHALERIPRLVQQQTRLDRGVEEAHRELVGPRHKAANKKVMIVLTDGLANPVPASTAVRRAQEAKNSGITVFAIGLGRQSELDVDELTRMSTTPAHFFHAPDGEDLLGIYQSIAVAIPCPAVSFWGRRPW